MSYLNQLFTPVTIFDTRKGAAHEGQAVSCAMINAHQIQQAMQNESKLQQKLTNNLVQMVLQVKEELAQCLILKGYEPKQIRIETRESIDYILLEQWIRLSDTAVIATVKVERVNNVIKVNADVVT